MSIFGVDRNIVGRSLVNKSFIKLSTLKLTFINNKTTNKYVKQAISFVTLMPGTEQRKNKL